MESLINLFNYVLHRYTCHKSLKSIYNIIIELYSKTSMAEIKMSG